MMMVMMNKRTRTTGYKVEITGSPNAMMRADPLGCCEPLAAARPRSTEGIYMYMYVYELPTENLPHC